MQCDFGNRTKAFRDGIKFLIDPDDYQKLVKDYRFYLDYHGYVRYSSRSDGLRNKLLSRVIMGEPNGKDVDHINRNPLDNRRENLRICTHQQNQYNRTKQSNNTSGFKGVSFNKEKQKFEARIGIDGKSKFLGYFDTAEKASECYKQAALKHHGDFARF